MRILWQINSTAGDAYKLVSIVSSPRRRLERRNTILNTNFDGGLLRQLWPRLDSIVDILLNSVMDTKGVTGQRDISSPPTYKPAPATCDSAKFGEINFRQSTPAPYFLQELRLRRPNLKRSASSHKRAIELKFDKFPRVVSISEMKFKTAFRWRFLLNGNLHRKMI